MIVGHQIRVVILAAHVEVVCLSIQLVLVVTSSVSKERTNVAVVDKGPAVANEAHIDVDVLLGEVDINDVVISSTNSGVSVIGSNTDLTAAELQLMEMSSPETKLRKYLSALEAHFDFIIIDLLSLWDSD